MFKILKSRMEAGENIKIRILDPIPSGPLYWADEYQTKPDPLKHFHFAFKVSDLQMVNHRWFHLVVPAVESLVKANGNPMSRLPRELIYMADSIVNLTDRKYVKNRDTGVRNEDCVDEDFINFMMDWPVTEIHDLYDELLSLTGRKIWKGRSHG